MSKASIHSLFVFERSEQSFRLGGRRMVGDKIGDDDEFVWITLSIGPEGAQRMMCVQIPKPVTFIQLTPTHTRAEIEKLGLSGWPLDSADKYCEQLRTASKK